ncbi:MAG: lytic murein transglycosylase [Candidatus Yonathbacteria bacterium]|nr:lytic murein transglycosylase [Candidatus Yonathbacteria bacterium]
MFKSFRKKISAILNLSVMFSSVVFMVANAQTTPSCLPEDDACRAKLESELATVEKEIEIQNDLIVIKQREGVSLERDVVILNAQIEKAKLSIKARNLSIAGLSDDITKKKRTIIQYSATIDREREALAGLMRRTNELDTYSIVEVVLSEKPFSEFFKDLDAFPYVEESIDKSLEEVGAAKKITEEAKTVLEEKKDKETDLRYQKETEKKSLSSKESEKVRLLKVTQMEEKAYQKVLKEKQVFAAKIRAALFSLRDTGEIPFGQAYDYAKTVSQKTGVRPAFLLAIFMQESGFGKNQGSCYLKDSSTGAGTSSHTGSAIQRVMKPERDIAPFIDITKNVGRDPFNTLVSCPQTAGYGGAMGPAQFIPSTWVLYEKLITTALDIYVADPWRARDAFMAAGFLLKDNGARSGSYTAERDAACKYFSGSKCSRSSWAATYGSQVMQKAETIQTTMIDPIENS